MAVDYDLVIIGSSWAGINAAQKAAQLQARVALVTQSDDLFLPDDLLLIHSVSEAGQLNQQLADNFFSTTSPLKFPVISLPSATEWAKGINSLMQVKHSLSGLTALGVDVIADKGEFFRLPKLAFQVGQRKLRSRHFLLATGTIFVPMFIDANIGNSYITLRELWQQDLTSLGQNIIVVGEDSTALLLAQTLAKFDKKITLIVKQSRILPQEDLDIALLIQAQLEAVGIKIYTDSAVSQIKTIDDQKWLQAGDRALTADEIIIADYRQPNISGLNLAGVNVKYDQTKVQVNQKLQTTNSKISACGDLIGGYNLLNITSYEINIILKNTLFFSWYKTNYHTLPWAILTQPNLARVGLTEQQARQKYGEEIYIIKEYLNDIIQAQIVEGTSGICKLLVRENGEILGCSLLCDRAGELITTIALMMTHKIKLDHNPMRGLTSLSIPTIYPSMAEILQRSSQNFYLQKLQRHPKLLTRLRSWFSFKRSWD